MAKKQPAICIVPMTGHFVYRTRTYTTLVCMCVNCTFKVWIDVKRYPNSDGFDAVFVIICLGFSRTCGEHCRSATIDTAGDNSYVLVLKLSV